jgi:hypothetical protein
VGSCEVGNELLGSIKGRELYDYLRDYLLASQEGLCSMELARRVMAFSRHYS